MKCNCGSEVKEMKAYFHIESMLRVTACDGCANEHGLNNEKNYYSKPISELTQQDNKTPDPNAINK